MNIPSHLKYSKDHEWIHVDGDVATIGITDFAQSELGDIVYVDIAKRVGDTITKDEVFGTVEAVKTVSDLFAPAGGELLEINAELNNAPESVNNDPYGNGWMIKIRLSNTNDLDELLNDSSYQTLIGK